MNISIEEEQTAETQRTQRRQKFGEKRELGQNIGGYT
jgi:hypothetical protein